MNVRIIGLGNVLMSDDGFGPYVVRVLEAFYEFPAGVQVIDAGAPGIDVLSHAGSADALIVVDTFKAQTRPGDVQSYHREDVLRQRQAGQLMPHAPQLEQALRSFAVAGVGPSHVLLVGTTPEWVATGVRLSQSVQSAVTPAIALIITELNRLGITAKRRVAPRLPDTWWERGEDVSAKPYIPAV